MLGLKTNRWIVVLSLIVAVATSAFGGEEDYFTWSDSTRIYVMTGPNGAAIAPDNAYGTAKNFPVLIRLTPDNFGDFGAIKEGGDDIRFTGIEPGFLGQVNAVPLSYAISRWVDGPNDQDTAEIWVKMNRVGLYDDNQYILMHWGKADAPAASDPQAVFSKENGFHGVWHLDESADGTGSDGVYKDASSAQAHGKDMVEGEPAEGMIGLAPRFNGSSDYIECPGLSDSIGQDSTLMVSAWIKLEDNGTHQSIAWKYDRDDDGQQLLNSGFGLQYRKNDAVLFRLTHETKYKNVFLDEGIPMDGNTWYYVAGTYLGTTGGYSLNINAESKKTNFINPKPKGEIGPNSIPLNIGRDGTSAAGSDYAKGVIDEVRVEKIRTGEWIKLCYENQKPLGEQMMIGIGGQDVQSAQPRTRAAMVSGSAGAHKLIAGRRDLARSYDGKGDIAVYDLHGRKVLRAPGSSLSNGVIEDLNMGTGIVITRPEK